MIRNITEKHQSVAHGLERKEQILKKLTKYIENNY